MITKKQLTEVSKNTGLNVYQQEKDYLLKLFLYNYYRRYGSAVFKGGTCIKYLYGLGRFSEDMDFNITNTSVEFGRQVDDTLKEIRKLGIENRFIKRETFTEAFTCEIAFNGPLHAADGTRNKFRIDAGRRFGVMRKPLWQVMPSEYPDTPANYLVLAMDESEMLAEKIIALTERKKGRDLYDAWYLIKKGVAVDKKLLHAKARQEGVKIDAHSTPSRGEYERDMKRLVNQLVPYEQAKKEVLEALTQPDR